MKNFRLLRADEIDCRVGTVKKDGSGFSLLLYKDARVDMNILDETVGPLNWQKSYSRDNANCTVSIWDEDKRQWISKEDTGTESNTEAEKGLASDSFKRACFNWGIGRELYTAPFIWVNKPLENKYEKFYVRSISYDESRSISQLEIVDEKGKQIYSTGVQSKPAASKVTLAPTIGPEQKALILAELNRTKVTQEQVCERYGVKTIDDLTEELFAKAYKCLKSTPNA